MYQLSQSAGSSVNTDCKSQLYLILIGRLFWELCWWTLNKLYWRDHTLCNWWSEDHRNNLSYTRMTGLLKKFKNLKKEVAAEKLSRKLLQTICNLFFMQTFCLPAFLFPPPPPPFFYRLSQMSWSSFWPATVLEHAKWTLSPSFLAENLWQKNIYLFLGKSCITSCCCLSHHCRILMSHWKLWEF